MRCGVSRKMTSTRRVSGVVQPPLTAVGIGFELTVHPVPPSRRSTPVSPSSRDRLQPSLPAITAAPVSVGWSARVPPSGANSTPDQASGSAGTESAGTGARTKDQAREKAQAVLADAKSDFSKAVARGDRGSTASAGRVPRGVLEPAAEYVLFTLPKGEVAPAPVDTPRGYWVVRRND